MLSPASERKRQQGIIRSRRMRRRPTKHERILLDALKRSKYRFQSQPFYFDEQVLFIPDFFIPLKKKKVLIVEVDGPSHKKQEGYDRWRTQWLETNYRTKVIRFTNQQVEENVEAIIAEIATYRPRHFVPKKKKVKVAPEPYEDPYPNEQWNYLEHIRTDFL